MNASRLSPEDFGGPSAREFAFSIQFEHDQLTRSLPHWTMPFLQKSDHILIEFDLDVRHGPAYILARRLASLPSLLIARS